MGHGGPLKAAVAIQDIDETPVGEFGNGQPRDFPERRSLVERRREDGAGFGKEPQRVFRFFPHDSLGGLGQGTLNRWHEPIKPVLENVIGGTTFEGFDGEIFAEGPGNEDERNRRTPLARDLERRDPIERRE
jgi:hypothetical protein